MLLWSKELQSSILSTRQLFTIESRDYFHAGPVVLSLGCANFFYALYWQDMCFFLLSWARICDEYRAVNWCHLLCSLNTLTVHLVSF
jgi:hypothetical protein